MIYKSTYFHFAVLSFHFSLLKVLPPYQLSALCSVGAVSQIRETGAALRQLCQGWSFAPALMLQEKREPQSDGLVPAPLWGSSMMTKFLQSLLSPT